MDNVRVYVTEHDTYVTDEENNILSTGQGLVNEKVHLAAYPLIPGEKRLDFSTPYPETKFYFPGCRVFFNLHSKNARVVRLEGLEITDAKLITQDTYRQAMETLRKNRESSAQKQTEIAKNYDTEITKLEAQISQLKSVKQIELEQNNAQKTLTQILQEMQ